MTINDILEKFDQITNDGDGWLVCCPVHGDTNPSLRISLTDGGKVLMNCRSQDCCFADIVAAVGLTTANFSNVQSNGERTIGAAGTKVPATDLDVAKLSELVDQLAVSFRGSPSSDYAWDRWGIDEEQAKDLKLGHLHPVDEHPLMQRQFARVQAVAIPLLDFDGQPKGMQRRSLFDDADRWSTLMNPATDRSWSRLGVMLHDHADDYILLTEGPGDALSAYAAGQSAVCLRGSSTMVKKSIDEIIDRLGQKMVVLAGDADQAGQLFNKNAGALLKAANIDVRVLQLPAGAGDLTEWREESGGLFAQQLLRAIRSAVPFLDEQHPDAPIQSSEESYAFTDKGNGQRLVKWLGDNFINTQELGHLMYADGRWAPDTKNNLPMAWSKCLEQMIEEGNQIAELGRQTDNQMIEDKGQRMVAWSMRCQNQPRFNYAIKMAEIYASKSHDIFDQNLDVLNVANGTVDLNTGQLKPHNREDYLTHLIDVEYDPEAKAPRFMQFLAEIFPDDPTLPKFMQTLCGYLATGHINEQIIVTCHGGGANGKSVFWGAINHVLDDIVKHTTMSTFEKRAAGGATADLAYLRGCRIVNTQESEANQVVSEATLKRVSGGDLISCRALYKAPFSYMPQFTCVFSLNHLFRIRSADESIWRRQVLIPFNRFFTESERDPDLLETLYEEAPGILAWIVQGATDWYANGLQKPEVVVAATETFKHGSDELAGFLGTVISPDAEGSLLGADLMSRYMDWCQEENCKPWSRTALFNGVIERVRGAHKQKKSKGIYLMGVDWASEAEEIAESGVTK